MKKTKLLLSWLTVLFLCAAVRAEAPPKPIRIVSLMPSNTEIVFALGAGSQVIGVTRYCDYPPEVKTIEQIGDFLHPNIEKVLSLKPDLVLAGKWPSSNTVARLRKAGLRVVEVDLPPSIDGIFQSILEIGELVGKKREGELLVKDLRGRVDKIKAQAKKRKTLPKVFIHIDNPNWTVTKNSFINDALESCGSVNIYRDLPTAGAQVSMESVVERNPDILLVSEIHKNEIVKRPGWHSINAVKRDHVFQFQKNTLNRPTPRIVIGMEQFSAKLKEIGY